MQAKLTAVPSLSQVLTERPVRRFCEDESRFGLLPVQRRRMALSGIKPVGQVQYQFEHFYVYGAGEPTTGEHYFLELPHLNTANFQILMNEFADYYQESLHIIDIFNICYEA